MPFAAANNRPNSTTLFRVNRVDLRRSALHAAEQKLRARCQYPTTQSRPYRLRKIASLYVGKRSSSATISPKLIEWNTSIPAEPPAAAAGFLPSSRVFSINRRAFQFSLHPVRE